MKTQKIRLLAGAINVKVHEVKNDVTTIHFNCPIWKDKTCIYRLPGVWEIKSINRNLVTLVNNDVIIKENGKEI
jgi:hypothetical protein